MLYSKALAQEERGRLRGEGDRSILQILDLKEDELQDSEEKRKAKRSTTCKKLAFINSSYSSRQI